jgi:hypothetical protein
MKDCGFSTLNLQLLDIPSSLFMASLRCINTSLEVTQTFESFSSCYHREIDGGSLQTDWVKGISRYEVFPPDIEVDGVFGK